MELIRFTFICENFEPVYARLCNKYLTQHNIGILYYQEDHMHCFTMEKKGNEQELQTFAMQLGNDFLISIWLIENRVEIVEQEICKRSPIELPQDSINLENLLLDEIYHEHTIVGKLTNPWRSSQLNANKFAKLANVYAVNLSAVNLKMEPQIARDMAFSNSAIIHFSSNYTGGLITLNNVLKTGAYFILRTWLNNNIDLLSELRSKGKQEVVDRYSQAFPEDAKRLSTLHFTRRTDNLTALYIAAAITLGFKALDEENITLLKRDRELLEKFLTVAAEYWSSENLANTKAIDFTLIKNDQDEIASFDFALTIASLMSYRLDAGGESTIKASLAFALLDSLANALIGIVEKLDLNFRIKQVILVGNELDNTVLTEQIKLRMDEKYPIFTASEKYT